MTEPIRVLIADDQALVRGALATLLGLERDIEVVAEVGTGREAVARALAGGVDVALLDIEMPGGDGLWAAGEIAAGHEAGAGERAPEATGREHERAPGAASRGCRSIIVTTFGRPGYLSRALEAGASGFLVKDTPPAELAEAVRRVHAGLRVIDPTLAQESVLLGPNPLTEREREVLRLAARGSDAPSIAVELSLGEGTVRNYLSSAIAKTQSRNRIEAARIAESNGWL